MFKKQGSYVVKGNKQIQEGDTVAAMQTIIEGLNYYQNKAIKALNPYPVSDAALIVLTMRTFADAVEKQNPDCKALVKELDRRMKSPEFQVANKNHKVK